MQEPITDSCRGVRIAMDGSDAMTLPASTCTLEAAFSPTSFRAAACLRKQLRSLSKRSFGQGSRRRQILRVKMACACVDAVERTAPGGSPECGVKCREHSLLESDSPRTL